jgi:hypothetical protein
MTRRLRWKPAALWGLAGLTLVASLPALAALIGQTGPLMTGAGVGFSQAHDQRAFALLSTGAPLDRLKAETEARRALALSPYENAARLRLADAYAASGPPVDVQAIGQLATSYDLVQYDYTVASWRIAFGLANWGRLPPDLRRSVYAEAMAFGRANSRDVDVRRILQSIRDPQGRLAAALWLHALKK